MKLIKLFGKIILFPLRVVLYIILLPITINNKSHQLAKKINGLNE